MGLLEKNLETDLTTLDRSTLTGIVQRAGGSDSVELAEWHVETLKSGMGPATGGVYRFCGTGWDSGSQVEWSLVLKVVRLEASPFSQDFAKEEHELYWKREALAYESGMLGDLPGAITAARCYGIVMQTDGSIWLWLEDVKESLGPEWPLVQYADAARR